MPGVKWKVSAMKPIIEQTGSRPNFLKFVFPMAKLAKYSWRGTKKSQSFEYPAVARI